MCTYSMIVDHYHEKWWPQSPYQPNNPNTLPGGTGPTIYPPMPSQEDIEEFKKLLERARKYDKDNNQPDCDLETKKTALRELAKVWGIDIGFIDQKEDSSL